MSVAPIAQEAGVPLMTPTGTGDSITAIGDYIFRAAYKDSLQGKVMARFAAENLGLKRVAIMYDIANDYSVGLMNAFKNAFEELGGTIVSTQSYTTGDRDFSAQLTSILLANLRSLHPRLSFSSGTDSPASKPIWNQCSQARCRRLGFA